MKVLNKIKQTEFIKKYALIIFALVIVAGTVGGTIAWLTANASADNSFDVAQVSCSVEGMTANNNQSNIKIKNTGTIDEYIRATIVLSWVDDNGDTLANNVLDTDYSIQINSVDWFKGSDGNYYYKEKVQPNAMTTNLINTLSLPTSQDGKKIKLEIFADSIQTDPKEAVLEAWSAVEVDTDGKLNNR